MGQTLDWLTLLPSRQTDVQCSALQCSGVQFTASKEYDELHSSPTANNVTMLQCPLQ